MKLYQRRRLGNAGGKQPNLISALMRSPGVLKTCIIYQRQHSPRGIAINFNGERRQLMTTFSNSWRLTGRGRPFHSCTFHPIHFHQSGADLGVHKALLGIGRQ